MTTLAVLGPFISSFVIIVTIIIIVIILNIIIIITIFLVIFIIFFALLVILILLLIIITKKHNDRRYGKYMEVVTRLSALLINRSIIIIRTQQVISMMCTAHAAFQGFLLSS